MSIQEWGVVGGLMVALALALAPWMFMVHGKLAALTVQIKAMAETVKRIDTDNRERLCERHRMVLSDHERRITGLEGDHGE